MYIIELITDRYMTNGQNTMIVGYTKTEKEADEYCKRKSKKLEGTYNEEMGKYYTFRKIELIAD